MRRARIRRSSKPGPAPASCSSVARNVLRPSTRPACVKVIESCSGAQPRHAAMSRAMSSLVNCIIIRPRAKIAVAAKVGAKADAVQTGRDRARRISTSPAPRAGPMRSDATIASRAAGGA